VEAAAAVTAAATSIAAIAASPRVFFMSSSDHVSPERLTSPG
jgi:hypothetical protein